MSAQGWIFMVGLRVFDVGLLVAWLIWFFRQRFDDDGSDDGDGGIEPADPPPGGSPPELELPRPDAEPWPSRRRDHDGDRVPASTPVRPTRRRPERPRVPAQR